MSTIIINEDTTELIIETVGVTTGGGGGSGWIIIADASAGVSGTVSNQVYQNPANTVLESFTTSDTQFDLFVRSSFPSVTVNAVGVFLPPAADDGHYEGNVSVTITASGTILATANDPDGDAAATDTVIVTLSAPPVIAAANFTGGYPGLQTELKQGDVYSLTVTADKNFDQVVLSAFGVSAGQTIGVTATTSTTVVITIADQGTTVQDLIGRVAVRDAVTAALSATFDTDTTGSVDGVNTLKLNNLFPSGAIGVINYPGIQDALKAVEGGTVNHTATDFDTILYVDPTTTDITIANTGTFEAAKAVTCLNPGDFNNSSTNFRYTMNRAANDATTIVNGIVVIADVAVVISVAFAAAAARSGVSPGNDTTTTISGDQPLLNAPSLDPAASRGTFQGSWAGGGASWTRALRVLDSENPADGSSNTWLNLVATNLAGTVTSVITTGPTYVIRGLAQRTLNYTPLNPTSAEQFPLTDENKLIIGSFSDGNPGVLQPFGTADTSGPSTFGWWAPNSSGGGLTDGRMLNTDQVASNGAGMTLSNVEELV